MSPQITIVYISGSGRSGTTLLGRLLGQADDFCYVGEGYYLADRGVLQNQQCGCGSRFLECTFWRDVLGLAFGRPERFDWEGLGRMRDSACRTRSALLRQRSRLAVDVEPLATTLTPLYHAISSLSGNRVLVDSSKFPLYGYALSRIPNVRLYVVHLIRDPRGCSFSWKRKKRLGSDGNLMAIFPPPRAGALWIRANVATEMLWRKSDRYFRVRYESLIDAPHATVSQLVHEINAASEPSVNRLLEGDSVELAPSHSISANPMRFDHGPIKFHGDAEWKHSMALRDKAVVTLMTWPWLLRYGYPLWV